MATMPAMVCMVGMLAVLAPSVGGSVFCVYSYNANREGLQSMGMAPKQMPGTILPGNETILCPGDEYSCFTLWGQVNWGPASNVTILLQGCWKEQEYGQCTSDQCSSGLPRNIDRETNHSTYFCCCSGDQCNANVTGYIADPVPTTVPPVFPVVPNTKRNVIEMALLLSVVSFTGVSIVVILCVLFCRLCFRKPDKGGQPLPYVEPIPVEPDFDFNDLEILELIGQGRYCNVYKGVLEDMEVAVKIFAGASRECYSNELDIYSIQHLGHRNVLKFIGSGERKAEDGWLEYLLITELIHCGSLMSYLKEHTYDWHAMCKLAQTTAAGLAHLHLASSKEGKSKPAIVHRDINSRNVLVRTDGTCVIGDFGFAMKVCGASIMKDGNRDNSNITDVGTVRYMAPEVLDGAVNLRDCECALKQVDIYSLGLVLWELATRCKDLYPGTEPPTYKFPFQEEVGLHPSFAEMQVLVCTDRGRPAFPDEWKDNHMALRSLKDTIEECWDHDAEARLTALCVEERIIELMVLWDKHRALTPTINQTQASLTLTTPNTVTLGRDIEPFLNRENRLEQMGLRQGPEILPYGGSSEGPSGRARYESSDGMEKNERPRPMLSPGTVSTSLSSPSELNLIDFTCGNGSQTTSSSVDPKNLHSSDDSIERFTTDLKYGSMRKKDARDNRHHPDEDSSSLGEPAVSPTQGLVLNEMPPPLSRDQMTDNLSSQEGWRRTPWLKHGERHPPKDDVNRQRQLAKAAAEQKPPTYEQVTGQGSRSPPAGQVADRGEEGGGGTPININNPRPSTLPLISDPNVPKKKMMAVYIPDCGPSTRVETGIAHLDNLDNPCRQATHVAPARRRNLSDTGSGGSPRPDSGDASGESEQSMSEEFSRTSSRSGSAEDVAINGSLSGREKRRGTPYRLLSDEKLSVSRGAPDRDGEIGVAMARPGREADLDVSLTNNNVSSSRGDISPMEGLRLHQNGAVDMGHRSSSRAKGKPEYQVSMV